MSHRDPPLSISSVLGFQACTSMSGSNSDSHACTANSFLTTSSQLHIWSLNSGKGKHTEILKLISGFWDTVNSWLKDQVFWNWARHDWIEFSYWITVDTYAMQTVVMEAKRLSIEPSVLTVKKYMNVCVYMGIYTYSCWNLFLLMDTTGIHLFLIISLWFLIFENV